MRNWRLQYDGDNHRLNVDEFISRAETRTRTTLRGDFSSLVNSFHQLLSDNLSNWYWTYLRSNPNPSWESIKSALRSDWGDNLRDVDLRRQMLGRRQQPRETFAAYYQDMVSFRNQLKTPMADSEFIETVRSNLLPYIQEQICLHRADTIGQLRTLVTEVQLARSRSRAALPSTAHHRARVEENYPCDTDHEPENWVDHPEPVDAITRYQPSITRCWNCDKEGHLYNDCDQEPTGFFCYGCGRKGVVKPRCPNCMQKKPTSCREQHHPLSTTADTCDQGCRTGDSPLPSSPVTTPTELNTSSDSSDLPDESNHPDTTFSMPRDPPRHGTPSRAVAILQRPFQPQRQSQSTPVIFPRKPYHQRLQEYRAARERIFMSAVEYPQGYISDCTFRKPKRSSMRLRKFWFKVRQNRKCLSSAFVSVDKDIRPYA